MATRVKLLPGMYELSVRVENGDTHYCKRYADNFHDAALIGIDFAHSCRGQLERIERISD